MFSRAAIRNTRNFSGKVFRAKTVKEAWLHDKGSWPVLACIVGALAFTSCTSLWFIFAHPDSRITKSARKSIFRGELEGKDHE